MEKGIDLRPLKRWLMPGDIAIVAKQVGITTVQASYIMSGKCRNWDFVAKLLEKVEYYKSLQARAESLY